jgi:hypothetical protein
MPGPSAREGNPAAGTTSAERARAPATAKLAEGYRPGRWIPASCRNDGRVVGLMIKAEVVMRQKLD